MALSIESIYNPVSSFFVNKFNTEPDVPISFRFDKFGSTIEEKDFIDVDNPDDSSRATESFSDFVNRLAIEDSDGVNIYFGSELIDSEYFRLLSASLPISKDDDSNNQDIIEGFIKMKADALREWERLSLVRGGGIMDQFRVSFATPSNWYNPGSQDIWTSQKFEISESSTTPPDTNTKFQLWKYKLEASQLQAVLPALEAEKAAPQLVLKDAVTMSPMLMRARMAGAVHTGAGPAVVVRDHRALTETMVAAPVVQNLKVSLKNMDLKSRLSVLHYIRENAPTQPSKASSLKINFDYCLVNIRRPWFTNLLTKNKSWFIPGMSKGEISAKENGINLSVLPIGLIAIKNLCIEANWSQQEILASKDGNATDFGPFEVSSEIIDNKLSHEGIQIVGWVVQKMPDIPPNDPPNRAASANPVTEN